MRKIPTLLVREEQDRRYVTRQVTPGTEWVLAGEGRPTRKYDGTCVLLDTEGVWWARREVKPGRSLAPPGWRPIDGPDDITGKVMGWEPMSGAPLLVHFAEAGGGAGGFPTLPGTYELCGPKVNGNPEGLPSHRLFRHADAQVDPALHDTDWAHDGIDRVGTVIHRVHALAEQGWEGIVWHHPDGRMAKLKARDLRSPEAYDVEQDFTKPPTIAIADLVGPVSSFAILDRGREPYPLPCPDCGRSYLRGEHVVLSVPMATGGQREAWSGCVDDWVRRTFMGARARQAAIAPGGVIVSAPGAPPTRRLRYTLAGHCDDLAGLQDVLRCIETDLEDGQETCDISSSQGFHLTVEITDPEQTPQRYNEQLRAWIDRQHAATVAGATGA